MLLLTFFYRMTTQNKQQFPIFTAFKVAHDNNKEVVSLISIATCNGFISSSIPGLLKLLVATPLGVARFSFGVAKQIQNNFGREVTFSIQVAVIATSNTPLNITI